MIRLNCRVAIALTVSWTKTEWLEGAKRKLKIASDII